MKRVWMPLFCLPFVLVPADGAPATVISRGINREAMLRTISAIESGNRNWVIGNDGERSAWQMMPDTWRKYTKLPFELASTNEVLAQSIARAHLQGIIDELGKNGRTVTPTGIARKWNPGAPRDYAQRTANLYGEEAKRK